MSEQNQSESRAQFIEAFIERVQAADGKLPLLTLAEFFNSNTEEESIAPNQWEYGRPSLAEVWERLRGLEARPDVAWVRVQLHEDTEIAGDDTVIAGDAIAICTTASTEEIEIAADTESLCSDGVIEGWVSSLDSFTDIPVIPDGYRVVSLVWD